MINDAKFGEWEVAYTASEVAIEEGVLSRERASSFMVYQLVPPDRIKITSKDFVSLRGRLTCACGYEIALDATIDFEGWLKAPSKHLEACPQCWRRIDLSGHTTGDGDSVKLWLLVTPGTGKEGVVEMPGTASGLPELDVDEVEHIPDQREGLRRWEESLGSAPASDEKPSAPTGRPAGTVVTPQIEAEPSDRGDERMPSEVIWELFERRQLDPNGRKILAFAILHERDVAPVVWVGPGPDPFEVEGEGKQTRHLRFLASKIVPGYQPHFIPTHLRIENETAIAGRLFEPGESLEVGHTNQVLSVMLADLVEDRGLVDDQELRNCSALSLSGNSVALGEGRFGLLVR
jgi:hypothetical protein